MNFFQKTALAALLATIFLITSLALGYIYIKYDKKSVLQEKVDLFEQKEEVTDIN